MTSSNLSVSVVIPTLDRAHFLPAAIASVRAQNVEGTEIVIVDDGSTDDTSRVVEELRSGGSEPEIRYYCQEHRGVSAARNRGLAEARGEVIAFLDSDDVWPDGSLRHRLHTLAENPHADIVYGKTRIRCIVPGTSHRRFRDGESVFFSSLCSMVIRRATFERVGPINEEFAHSEDVEWLARAKEKGVHIVQTDFVVLEYRIHDRNMTSDVEENRAFLFRALKQSLDRRRGGGGAL
jgi:glycosyltransferase involved in cell wall biosynthesis